MGLLVAAVAAFAAAFSHSSGSTSRVQNLYPPTRGTIAAFAQDGPVIAWLTKGGTRCNVVHVQQLSNGLHLLLPAQSVHNVTCRFTWDSESPVGLAIARDVSKGEAIWTLPESTPLPLDYLLGAGVTPANQTERRFLEIAHTARGVGQWLGGIAGDGSTLVYGVTSIDYDDEASCLAGTGPCTLRQSGGGVYRIQGRQAILVPKTDAAVEVAASGSAIAYVGTGGVGPAGRPVASADVPIEIVDSHSGEEISSVLPQGVPVAIALTPHVLASLERTPIGLRVAWYDRATGQPRGSVPVPSATSPTLTASDQVIVFRVGRSLRAVNVDTHQVRVLIRAAARPIGLSLDGTRLAWGENLGTTYRIRALTVGG